MTQHSSEWCHRDVNGSEANRLPTANKTTVDQWWIDVGFGFTTTHCFFHLLSLFLAIRLPVHHTFGPWSF